MSRTLLTTVFVTLFATALSAQTSDPVADLTNEVISRFMPRDAYFPTRSQTLIAAPEDQALTETVEIDQTREEAAEKPAPRRSFWSRLMSRPEPKPQPKPWQIGPIVPREFRSPFSTSSSTSQSWSTSSSSVSTSRPLIADDGWKASEAPLPTRLSTSRKTYVPRPISFSQASSNGLHDIEAVVPTDRGPEKVNLRGTSREIVEQVEALPPQVRRVMSRSLGL